MRYSSYFIPTQKEVPADAEIISHQLMVRAGMIRKLTSGVYNYFPLVSDPFERWNRFVREEMNRAGAIEVLHARGAAGRIVAGERSVGILWP